MSVTITKHTSEDMADPKFALADLLKIQVIVGISSTLIAYPFIAAYWFMRHGIESFSLFGVVSELFTLALWACGTGLGMALMTLIAYPALKLTYRKGWLN